MFIVLVALLLISIVLEGVVTNLPLVLICLLCLTILKRDASIFLFAFFAGLFLDVFGLRPLGGTSVFFLSFVLLILLYQRKYEINSYQFVLVAAFLGSILFLNVFVYKQVWMLSLMTSLLASVLFGSVRLFTQPHEKKHEYRIRFWRAHQN